MSGTTSDWTPGKILALVNAISTYNSASACMAAMSEDGAIVEATIIVRGSNGAFPFSFNIVPAQAIGFFTPIVSNIAAGLTAQGVVLP